MHVQPNIISITNNLLAISIKITCMNFVKIMFLLAGNWLFYLPQSVHDVSFFLLSNKFRFEHFLLLFYYLCGSLAIYVCPCATLSQFPVPVK